MSEEEVRLIILQMLETLLRNAQANGREFIAVNDLERLVEAWR